MKQIFELILSCLILASTAPAQTNSVRTNASGAPTRYQPITLPPGYAALTNLHRQIVARENRIVGIEENENREHQRISMQLTARLITSARYEQLLEQNRRQSRYQSQALIREIAALKLQEMDLRQRYRIPESKTVRKK